MKPCNQITGNEQGSVLLLAILILFAVTMLGIFSTSTSTVELQVTANNAFRKKAFYAAEAGLEHARAILTPKMLPKNTARLAAGQKPVWTFALDGSETGIGAASLNDDDRPDFENGATWLEDVQLGDSTYTVRVYDDWEDDDDATADSNGRVYMRALGEGPRGSRAMVETILAGSVDEEFITGYTAQSGGEAVKRSEGADKNAISDDAFSTQGNNNPVKATDLGT
jgi:hypothetical protein